MPQVGNRNASPAENATNGFPYEISNGTRHVFGTPTAMQRFKIDGVDPGDGQESQDRTRTLMRKLSLRVEAGIKWADRSPAPAKVWENPLLPSGYAYLFQFVGHDLVNTTVPYSSAAGLQAVSSNARRTGLTLETLYGDGPVATRFAYEPSDIREAERTRLRLGRIQRDDRTTDPRCPFRDIARAPRETSRAALGSCELTEPLVADARNDAHAILSQLTSVFSLLHNGIVDCLAGDAPPEARSTPARAHALFATARALSAGAYRRVVKQDLLRRLMSPDVYRFYESGALLDPAGFANADWRAPLEFSQGAIRFGHAMVRDEYRINDAALNDLVENLAKTSLADPQNMPLNESWVVQWSHFFDMGDGRSPNLAKRIGPHYSSGLMSERIFPAIDDSRRVGLAYRDLMSSAFSGLWSLRPLIEEIRLRRPDFVRSWRVLDDHAWRQAQMASWLREQRAFGGLDADDIAAISCDPPLSFFVQWEAMQAADGLRLGPLGSILVGEAAFAALAASDDNRSRPSMRTVHEAGSDGAWLDRLSHVRAMPDLISFVRDVCGLSHAIPAFA